MPYPLSFPIAQSTAFSAGGEFGSALIPPAGFTLLIGADNSLLLGADNQTLAGKAS